LSKKIPDAKTKTVNSISSFTNQIYVRKIDKCLAKSFTTGFCFFDAFIRSNGSLEA
jgi:hypothetical protein